MLQTRRMHTRRRRRLQRLQRNRAVLRRFGVLAIYRFVTLFVVGIMPLAVHTFISVQTDGPESRTWATPELWLLSLVMWGSSFAESLAQESADFRCYTIRWGGFAGVVGSAYAYGSLTANAPAARALNEVFQRLPVYATILAVFAFMIIQCPEIFSKAKQEIAKERGI